MLTPRPKTPTQALDSALDRQMISYWLGKTCWLPLTPRHLKTHLRDFLGMASVLSRGYYPNVSECRALVARPGPEGADPLAPLRK